MAFEGTVDINWHHKEVVVLDLKWVNTTILMHVEMKQYEEQEHQGHAPAIILTRQSQSKQEDILVITGRAGGHVLLSLGPQDRLVGRIDPSNPNSAGTVKWEIVG